MLVLSVIAQVGWSDQIKLLALVKVGVILEYTQHRLHVESHPIPTAGLTLKPVNRGYKFFYWSYVHNMQVAAPSQEPGSLLQYFIKVECWASQKKTTKYSQKLLLSGTVEEYEVKIAHAHCLSMPCWCCRDLLTCHLLSL